MSITIKPQTKDFGDMSYVPNFNVDVNETEGYKYDIMCEIIGGDGHSMNTSIYDSCEGRTTVTPQIDSTWGLLKDGDCRVDITVTSFEEIKEQPINGSSSALYLEKTQYSYTGSSIEPKLIGFDSSKMTKSGNYSATNSGTYTFTVTPKSGYYWVTPQQNVNKYGAISFTYTITKKYGYVIVDTERLYDGNAIDIYIDDTSKTYKYYLYCSFGNTFSIPSNASENISILPYYDNTIRISANSNGTRECMITAYGNSEYNDVNFTVRVHCNVAQKISSVPYQANTDSLYADGNYKTPTWYNYDSSKLVIGGTTGAYSAGTYYATFTPTNGNQWWDGSTSSKYASWKINEAYTPPPKTYTFPVTLDNRSVTVSWANSQIGYVQLKNNTDMVLMVKCEAGTGKGPFGSFSPTNTKKYNDIVTLGVNCTCRLYIDAGSPPSQISTNHRVVHLEYRNNNDTSQVVGTDTVTVNIIS